MTKANTRPKRLKSALEVKREYRLLAVTYLPLGVIFIISGAIIGSSLDLASGFINLAIGLVLAVTGLALYINSNRIKAEIEEIPLVTAKEEAEAEQTNDTIFVEPPVDTTATHAPIAADLGSQRETVVAADRPTRTETTTS